LVGPPNGGPYVQSNGTTDNVRRDRLQAAAHQRDMLGARVEIIRKGKPSLWRRSRADGSYASANDPRVLAGLGESSEPVTVRVFWPDGRSETWKDLGVDRYVTLAEGEAK
jgi:hypothetical protein